MGSRSSFKNVNAGDFSFVDGGKTFRSIGGFDNVKILVRDSGSVKAPEFSHTAGRIYAIVQDGKLKHLAYYDENHKQAVSIDLQHAHHGVQPHKHLYLDHSDKGIPLSEKEKALVNEIKERFGLR